MLYHYHGWPNLSHPAGEPRKASLRFDFDRRLKLKFHGSKITSDAGLLAYRELDEALGLTEIAGAALSDLRRGKNPRHPLTGRVQSSSLTDLKMMVGGTMSRILGTYTSRRPNQGS